MDYISYLKRKRNIKIAAVLTAAFLELEELEKYEEDEELKRTPRKWWVNPYLRERSTKGKFAKDLDNMLQTPRFYAENINMSSDTFKGLFDLLKPHLIPKRCTRVDAIQPEMKLTIVLEFLASGDLQKHICSSYRISKQHMGNIIDAVCDAICEELGGEIPDWGKENMLQCADKFMEMWNFPNCIGAIDGKQIAIKAPLQDRSEYQNDKGLYSIILLGICDAKYRFTYIDIGAHGSVGDMDVFACSKFGQSVMADQLDFPDDKVINKIAVPYFFVGDEEFSLCKRIMKPYSAKTLSAEERIFNYRLNRARCCIGNAFAILSNKWLCLQRTLLCEPSRVQKVVSACCLLHNYLMRVNPVEYAGNVDLSTLVEEPQTTSIPKVMGRPLDYPKSMRNILKDYVNSDAGSVAWQKSAAGIEK